MSEKIYRALAGWFASAGRVLPWRQNRTAYRVWISEIMLQQTQVVTVIPYFERWMKTFPDIRSLAAAPEQDVLKAWEGLGYYSRARNILKTARLLSESFDGKLPGNFEALRKLPGIGDYTAGAIASLAFGENVPAADGNVLRVMARLTGTAFQAGKAADLKRCRALLREMMADLSEKADYSPAIFNEGLIELGALVCQARQADCGLCPLAAYCRANAEGKPFSYPLAAEKTRKAREIYTVLICRRDDGRFAVRQREPKGLLASLWEFPLLEGERGPEEIAFVLEDMGLRLLRAEPCAEARHVFSHLIWDLHVIYAEAERLPLLAEEPEPYMAEQRVTWLSAADVRRLPFSSALTGLRERFT